MIPVFLILGAAAILLLGFFVGRPAIVTLGVLFAILLGIGLGSDVRRYLGGRDDVTPSGVGGSDG